MERTVAASAEAPAEAVRAQGKEFRDYQPDQPMVMPPSLNEWLPAEHLAWFVDELAEAHLDQGSIDALFVQVPALCQQAGTVTLGNVGLGDTKIRANASRHRAMSSGRMVEREPELAAIVAEILEEAEQVDAEEDERFGGAREDEGP